MIGSVVEGSRGFEAGSILHGSDDEKGKLVILRYRLGMVWRFQDDQRLAGIFPLSKILLAEKKFFPPNCILLVEFLYVQSPKGLERTMVDFLVEPLGQEFGIGAYLTKESWVVHMLSFF